MALTALRYPLRSQSTVSVAKLIEGQKSVDPFPTNPISMYSEIFLGLEICQPGGGMKKQVEAAEQKRGKRRKRNFINILMATTRF